MTKIRENPGAIVIQVRDSDDFELATEALRRAREDIAALDGGPGSAPGLSAGDRNGPKFVGEVMPAATGPCLFIDGGHSPYRILRTIPDLISRRLVEVGVGGATITTPPVGGPILDACSPGSPSGIGAFLCLCPPPPPYRRSSRIPDDWLQTACEWISGISTVDGHLLAKIVPGSIEFSVPEPQSLPFLTQCRRARASVSILVSGDLKTQIRGVNGRFASPEPTLLLATGGPTTDEVTLASEVEGLKNVARQLSDEVAYAYIAIGSYRRFSVVSNLEEWEMADDGEMDGLFWYYCDRIVRDAFHYQVLGPRHVERLGGVPDGAKPLGNGRFELSVGEPTAWIDDDPPPEAQEPDRSLTIRERRALDPGIYAAQLRRSTFMRDKTVRGRGRALLGGCLIRKLESQQLFGWPEGAGSPEWNRSS